MSGVLAISVYLLAFLGIVIMVLWALSVLTA